MTAEWQGVTVLQNLYSGQVIKVTKTPYTIGRLLSSDYVIDNPIISRTHCSLWKSNSEWLLRDSSTNGTVVNDNLYIHQISILKYNDVICLGPPEYTFRFLLIYPNQEIPVNRDIISVNSSASVDNNGLSNQLDNIVPEHNLPAGDNNVAAGLDVGRIVSIQPNSEDVKCTNSTDQHPDSHELISVKPVANHNVCRPLIVQLEPSEQPSTSHGDQNLQQIDVAVCEEIDLTSSKTPEEYNMVQQPEENDRIIELSPTPVNGDYVPDVLENNFNNPSLEIQIPSELINDSTHSSSTSIYTIPDCVEQEINDIIDNYWDPGTSAGGASVVNTRAVDSCKEISSVMSASNQNCPYIAEPSTSTANQQNIQILEDDVGEKIDTAPEAVSTERIIQKEQYEKMESELMCSICSNLFIQAVTLGCSHSFCSFCIKTWKKRKIHCPICRTRISTTTRTLVLDNVVEKMVESLSAEDKEQRKASIEERQKLDTAQKQSPKRCRNRRANHHRLSPPPPPPPRAPVPMDYVDLALITDSDEEDEIDSEMELDEDWEDNVPYYGGYGRCYICNQIGHWANACPFRMPRFLP